jgi:hypothetical protein
MTSDKYFEVNMKKTTQILSAAVLSFTLFSCQKSNNNDLQDAQLCLNKAAASEAQNCVAKIVSDTSENAYKLRCAAVFISKSFGSPTSFVSALDQIKNGGNAAGCSGGVCSGTLAAMSTLNFGTDAASADQALSNCTNSGVGIYAQISSIFKIGTLLVITAGGATSTTSLETALATADPAAIGAVVQATYASSCQNTSSASQSTQQYCTELAGAIASGSTPTAIGQCLINRLNNPAATCP